MFNKKFILLFCIGVLMIGVGGCGYQKEVTNKEKLESDNLAKVGKAFDKEFHNNWKTEKIDLRINNLYTGDTSYFAYVSGVNGAGEQSKYKVNISIKRDGEVDIGRFRKITEETNRRHGPKMAPRKREKGPTEGQDGLTNQAKEKEYRDMNKAGEMLKDLGYTNLKNKGPWAGPDVLFSATKDGKNYNVVVWKNYDGTLNFKPEDRD